MENELVRFFTPVKYSEILMDGSVTDACKDDMTSRLKDPRFPKGVQIESIRVTKDSLENSYRYGHHKTNLRKPLHERTMRVEVRIK